jgi:hypothetical protein
MPSRSLSGAERIEDHAFVIERPERVYVETPASAPVFVDMGARQTFEPPPDIESAVRYGNWHRFAPPRPASLCLKIRHRGSTRQFRAAPRRRARACAAGSRSDPDLEPPPARLQSARVA